ncbi:cytochrome b [Methylocaldum marinum]|uniref:Cytochrome b n=1 Tax=Methylocaldum marinum TaxID=1432792 RepID=A0A250L0B9_9GAMM|nr:cytochrome b [Methylocaldum marinum]
MYAACHNAAQKQYPSIKVGDYEGFERMSFFSTVMLFLFSFILGSNASDLHAIDRYVLILINELREFFWGC